jgi:hypothetical protein
MMKVIDIEKAIALANAKHSLDGLAIKDLNETQVRAVDALALADQGVLIPEQNIIYRDEDVQYDPEFDDYSWTQLPSGTRLEDLESIVAQQRSNEKPSMNIELEVEDEKAMEWAKENYSTIKNMMNALVKELYNSSSMIENQ